MSKTEWSLLGLFIGLFIFIRSINFAPSLNFSTDPALFSTAALDIYRHHTLRLIGPTFSINFNGRYAFQGAVIYYFQLIFLLLGQWDPVISSYFFMLFCALMIIPLYLGSKLLINKSAARLMVISYTLVPFYINYSKFLWNPNFQFSLLPILILLMGLYTRYKKPIFLLAISAFSGVIVQFHYQLLAIVAGLFLYYVIHASKKTVTVLIFIFGFLIGFSPIILFEIRHNFYNLQTIYLFLTNPGGLGNSPHTLSDYYFLSISFFILLIVVSYLKKIKIIKKIIPISLTISLLIIDLLIYVPKPTHGFRMANNWDYSAELKVHQIIMSQHLKDFNITNLVYDTKADTQKYLLRSDNVEINYDDYYHNQYLFLVGTNKYISDPAYEISSFRPRQLLQTWKINSWYNLYLLTRDI